MSGIRARVTLAATAIVALVLVAVSVLLVARQRSALNEHLEDSLSTEAERVAAEAEAGQPITPPGDDDLVVLVLDSGGAVVAEAGDLDDVSALLASGATSGSVTLDDESYRVVSEDFDGASGPGLVVVAGSEEDVDESIRELVTSLLWIVPPAVVVLMEAVWLLTGRTLRPVDRIRRQVSEIGIDELDRRVPVPPGQDEIARLAVTMNEMLARLEASANRERRFVGDASHELRTPLARMRAELEVDERDPANADVAATRRSQLEEIENLQRLIGDLLLLARGEADTATVTDLVDLDDLVLEETGTQPWGAIAVDVRAVSAAQVRGNRDELRRVVRNLLDNARRHAGTSVTVALSETGADAVLVVADDGPGIPPEQRQLVFERFARLDESRTASGGHAGLGLAIVHDIVNRHGGTVLIDAAPTGGAQVTVVLPRQDAGDPS